MKKTPETAEGRAQHYANLVASLRGVALSGPSAGGPCQGVSDNEVTRAIVREGPAIVPPLISALDDSSFSQSVYIVFCLRELHASAAKERIGRLRKELEAGMRFAKEPHDFTLDVQVDSYLSQVEAWEQHR